MLPLSLYLSLFPPAIRPPPPLSYSLFCSPPSSSSAAECCPSYLCSRLGMFFLLMTKFPLLAPDITSCFLSGLPARPCFSYLSRHHPPTPPLPHAHLAYYCCLIWGGVEGVGGWAGLGVWRQVCTTLNCGAAGRGGVLVWFGFLPWVARCCLVGWLGGRAVHLLVHSKQALVGKATPRCCQNAAKHHPGKSEGPEVGANLVSSSSSSDVF